MGTVDAEEERTRLATLYSGMTGEELGELAEDPASLTDVARQALKAEIARRGLTVVPPDAPRASGATEPAALELIFDTSNWPEASIVKGLLESNGIEVTMQPSSAGALYAQAGFAGIIQLLVRATDAQEARRTIEQSELEVPDSEE